jgi:hypothetical protein
MECFNFDRLLQPKKGKNLYTFYLHKILETEVKMQAELRHFYSEALKLTTNEATFACKHI